MIYDNRFKAEASGTRTPDCEPLKEDIRAEALVVGGGFAGLFAALRLAEAGRDVVLLEKTICGGSSSGQSAGFLTPNSEEDFQKLVQKHGEEKAKLIYQVPLKGVELIVNTLKKHGFDCDFRKQDSLYFSNNPSHNSQIEEEAETLADNDIPHRLLDRKGLQKVHPGRDYLMGLISPGSYGINPFAFCQEMKRLLLEKGVRIYENSEVHRLEGQRAHTHLGSVTAEHIIVCIDKLKEELNEDFSRHYYHVQTYLSMSEPLSDEEMKALFPKEELMCWDTRWDYIHYRPVGGNRILIGGSSPWTAYSPRPTYSPRVISSFIERLKKSFPAIKDVAFNYYWSGMIDVTKDFVPIVDYDRKNRSVQYVMGCAGLNWAAYCGDYAARRVIDPQGAEDLSEFLRARREFTVSTGWQKILGKRLSFFISHVYGLLAE